MSKHNLRLILLLILVIVAGLVFWWKPQWRFALGIVVVMGVLLAILWELPKVQAKALGNNDVDVLELAKLENEFRKTVAQVIGGIVLLTGLYFTWLEMGATREQLRISQEGQITERFTRAVQQLGSDKVEIRLGGIYALERIARDSKKDHWPTMEILSAYIRENAPRKPESEIQRQCGPESNILPVFPQNPPPADVQAILTALGRRTRTYKKGENQPLDLRHSDLRRSNLSGAHLEGAILLGADLEGAILDGAYLEGANISGAHLDCAVLEGAHLEGAILSGTNLYMAYLAGADLKGVRFDGTYLYRANLSGADLTEAKHLTRTQIDSAFTDEKTRLPDYLKESE